MWANLKMKLTGLAMVGATWMGGHGGCRSDIPYYDTFYDYGPGGYESGYVWEEVYYEEPYYYDEWYYY